MYSQCPECLRASASARPTSAPPAARCAVAAAAADSTRSTWLSDTCPRARQGEPRLRRPSTANAAAGNAAEGSPASSFTSRRATSSRFSSTFRLADAVGKEARREERPGRRPRDDRGRAADHRRYREPAVRRHHARGRGHPGRGHSRNRRRHVPRHAGQQLDGRVRGRWMSRSRTSRKIPRRRCGSADPTQCRRRGCSGGRGRSRRRLRDARSLQTTRAGSKPRWRPPSSHGRSAARAPGPPSIAWTIGGLLLVLALLAQVTHFFRQDLVRHPQVGPVLKDIYSRLGVPCRRNWDLAAFELRQWGAASGAGRAGRLTVRASLTNRAAFAQPHPLLRLELEDRFGDAVAVRDFEPAEYLKDPAEATRLLGRRCDAEAELASSTQAGSRRLPARRLPARIAPRILRCAQGAELSRGASSQHRPLPARRPRAARADGRRHRPAVPPPVPAPGRGARGRGDDHRRPAALAHRQVAPAAGPRRRARAARRAARGRRSGDAGRRRARNVDAGAQIIDINMGCPAKKVCNRTRAPRCCAMKRWSRRSSSDGRGGRRAGDAEDPHRLEPRQRNGVRIARIAETRASRRSRCTAARAPPVRRARRSTKRFAHQAGRAHSGVRQRRHRLAGKGRAGAARDRAQTE